MITFKRASKYDYQVEHTANGGCILRMGCCTAAFSKPEEMLEALAEYYKNPDEMEKKYNAFAGPTDEPIGYGNMPEPDNRALRRSGPHDDEGCNCEEQTSIDHPGNN